MTDLRATSPRDVAGRSDDRRIEWIDLARGIGILAVVLWHVAGGLARAGIPAPQHTDALILAWDTYALRAMPVFFLVSGAMLGSGAGRPTAQIIQRRASVILWPYLVWSVISLMGGSLAGGATNNQLDLHDLPRVLYDPVLQFWFLPALLVITIAWLVPLRAGAPVPLLLMLAIGLGVGAVAVGPDAGWYFGRQVALFAVYFAVGAALGRPFVRRVEAVDRVLMAIVGLLSGAVVLFAVVIGPPDPWFPVVLGTGVLSTVSIVGLAAALSRTLVGRALSLLGKASLEIYVVHVIAAVGLRIVLVRALQLDSFAIHLLAGTVFGIAAGLVVARLGRVRGLAWMIRMPAGRPGGMDHADAQVSR